METRQANIIANYSNGNSNSMSTHKKTRELPAVVRKALDAAKEGAHQRILKREFVQFRTDQQMMDLLLRVSDHKCQPLGVMVREWVQQRLAEEAKLLPLPAVKLPSGELLTEKGSQLAIEKAVFNHQYKVIKLGEKEYQTLLGWLMDRHLAAKYARRA